MTLIILITLLESFLSLQEILRRMNKFLKVIVILNMIKLKGTLGWPLLLVFRVNVKGVNVNVGKPCRIRLIGIFILRYLLLGLKHMKSNFEIIFFFIQTTFIDFFLVTCKIGR